MIRFCSGSDAEPSAVLLLGDSGFSSFAQLRCCRAWSSIGISREQLHDIYVVAETDRRLSGRRDHVAFDMHCGTLVREKYAVMIMVI